MTGGRRVDRDGIHIERDVADRVAIEEELDSNVDTPYRFPSPRRRRSASWVYLATAILATLVVDEGWLIGLGLAALAVWHFMAAWPLLVDEHQALAIAAASVPFPVGHASASVRFTGWRSRPRWSVVLYAASDPPDRRGLVVVDAVRGVVVEQPYVEEIAGV